MDHCLGINLSVEGINKLSSKVMSVWVSHGDVLAMQYAGSIAMHKLDEKEGTIAGQREIFVNGGALNAVTAMQR